MTILEYKNSITAKRILSEIGELVTPYVTKGDIKIEENEHGEPSFKFEDDQGNSIEVLFTHIKGTSYEAEFSVNKNSFQDFKTTTAHYFKILSTVIGVINKFLQEYEPDMLMVNGIDKDKEHEGQKNDIYRTYSKAMIDQTDYKVGNLPTGFGLMKP